MEKLLMFSLFLCSLSLLYSLPNLGNPFTVEGVLLALTHQDIKAICTSDKHRLIRAAIHEVNNTPLDASFATIRDPKEQLVWRLVATLRHLETEKKRLNNKLLALNDAPAQRITRRPSTSSNNKEKKLLELQENELLRIIIATAANQFGNPTTAH